MLDRSGSWTWFDNEGDVDTVFDWLTMLTFVGLAVLYLQRSAAEEPRDKIWHYVPPAVVCAAANQAGNAGYTVVAVLGVVAVLAWIYYVLNPQINL